MANDNYIYKVYPVAEQVAAAIVEQVYVAVLKSPHLAWQVEVHSWPAQAVAHLPLPKNWQTIVLKLIRMISM